VTGRGEGVGDRGPGVRSTALGFGRWGGACGLVCGALYAFGGAVIDLLTVGPNLGTALAFGALIGMPAIGAACGLALGAVVGFVVHGSKRGQRTS